MTLEDELKQLMFYREKSKECKKMELLIKDKIIQYLKNHNQEGVTFKHNNKYITLMVESTNVKKNISIKEKEKKVQNILFNNGVQNIENTTQEIITGLKNFSIVDRKKDTLKFKLR